MIYAMVLLRADRFDCFKRLDGKYNYQEAKAACQQTSVDVHGNEAFRVSGEIYDHTGKGRDPERQSGMNH